MQLPSLFGKYELQKFLGGGMSQVYRASDTVLGRTVAVKILTDEGMRDEDTKKRFLLEARMSGSMVHDNIIRIHDYGEIDGRPFIVMEFLVGEDLRHAIDKGHTGDLKQKLKIALQAAKAMAFVHTKDIIHRDIKPENLHIDEEGRVRLMDFGIAKAHNLSITREGFAIGTPYYMSPEQVLGKPVTGQADIYSFGILLYELLTGLKPVMGETVESLFYLILHQPLNMEPLEQAGTPQDLVNLVARCGSKKPEERPASFGVVISELEAILRRLEGGAAIAAQGPAPLRELKGARPQAAATPVADAVPAPKKSMLPMIAGAGALVLALGLAVVFVPRGGDKKEPEKKVEKPVEKKGPAARIQDGFGEMILVPEGNFLSGPNSEVQRQAAFYIDKTEVSVGQWNRFAQAMGKTLRGEANDLPATNVTFDEAVEFASWAKKRLPTGEEWEKAARGDKGRSYPWGNEPDVDKVNVKGNSKIPPGMLQPVESMPESVTPEGVLHLAGNAWEWVNDPRKPRPESVAAFKGIKATIEEPWTTIRGGGYDFDIRAAVAYEFSTVPTRSKSPAVGFRCVKDARE